jgi:AraC-like DNA-binding protein
MHLVTRRPAPPLDAFVENLWAFHDTPAHTRERIVPAGTLELVINLAEDEIRIFRANTVARSAGVVVSGTSRLREQLCEVTNTEHRFRRLEAALRAHLAPTNRPAEVGMTPKLFVRVQRFQRALTRIGRLGQGQLALACGYFDQSHLIRDFADFAGITPAEYAGRGGNRAARSSRRAVPKYDRGRPSHATHRSKMNPAP